MKIIDKSQKIEEKEGKIILTQTVVWEYGVGQWSKDKKGKYLLYPHIRETDDTLQEELFGDEIKFDYEKVI